MRTFCFCTYFKTILREVVSALAVCIKLLLLMVSHSLFWLLLLLLHFLFYFLNICYGSFLIMLSVLFAHTHRQTVKLNGTLTMRFSGGQ